MAANPNLTLGELRVLISATDVERAAAEQAAGAIDGSPIGDVVMAELTHWAERCNRDPGDAGLLYLSGHGTSMANAGGFLLLEDFGAPGPLMAKALDIDWLRDAMETRLAHANFFFVDACQYPIKELREGGSATAIKAIDPPHGARTRSFYRSVYGAAPEETAWVLETDAEVLEHGTVFSKALLDALDTSADLEETSGWALSVTINRLIAETARNIEREGNELRVRYGEAIRGTSQASGTAGDRVFHVPDAVHVDLSIELDPAAAADTAQAQLFRYRAANVAAGYGPLALTPHPVLLNVETGKYQLQLVGPGDVSQANTHVVLPATAHWKVPVEFHV